MSTLLILLASVKANKKKNGKMREKESFSFLFLGDWACENCLVPTDSAREERERE